MYIYEHGNCGTPCTEPDLKKRSGRVVAIVRELNDSERDPEVGRMFHIRFDDGLEADAFEDELQQRG